MNKIKNFCKYFFLGLLIFLNGTIFAEEEISEDKKIENPVVENTENSEFVKKRIVNIIGNIKIVLNGKKGTFNISALDEYSNATSILETRDEGVSSFFSVLISNKEYKLENKTGISVSARKTALGGQILYSVQKIADVLVDFSCLKSDSESPENIVQVQIQVTNLTKRMNSYAVKSVLDTILGEHFSEHFVINSKVVNKQTEIKSFDDISSVISKNSKARMEVLFSGLDVTTPETVLLGNKDVLNRATWIPSVESGKPFDNVQVYNNSAIALIWASQKLRPSESLNVKFYIAVSPEGEALGTKDFIKNFGKNLEPENKTEIENLSENLNENQKIENPRKPEVEKILKKIDDQKQNNSAKLEQNQKNSNLSRPISKDQLNPEYIKTLIAKINSLDASNQLENSEYILLNEELDSILKILESENGSR